MRATREGKEEWLGPLPYFWEVALADFTKSFIEKLFPSAWAALYPSYPAVSIRDELAFFRTVFKQSPGVRVISTGSYDRRRISPSPLTPPPPQPHTGMGLWETAPWAPDSTSEHSSASETLLQWLLSITSIPFGIGYTPVYHLV